MQNSAAVNVHPNPAELKEDVRGAQTEAVVPQATQLSSAARGYRQGYFANLSPVRVIDTLYGVAIQACKKKNVQLAHKAISELIISLNFEYGTIALTLYQLYYYTQDCIRKGKMDEAIHVLDELRATWAQAFNL